MPQLSERENALLHMLPTLKEGEFRVAAQLILQAGEGDHVHASVRQLAERTRCSTSTVQAALASLEARGTISQLTGDRKTATVWTLHLGAVKTIGVSETDTRTSSTGVAAIATPPPVSGPEISTSVAAAATPGVSETATRVPVTDTPETAASEHHKAIAGARPARVDSESTPEEINRSIDRILAANADEADPDTLRDARSWLLGYMRKLGADPQAKPPDDAILAQFLAVAEWEGRGGLLELVHDLAGERAQPGDSYGWFVAVAAQRLLGIRPQALRARREQLRQERRKKPAREGLQHAGEIAQEIARRR
jgi:hypothetical protein